MLLTLPMSGILHRDVTPDFTDDVDTDVLAIVQSVVPNATYDNIMGIYVQGSGAQRITVVDDSGHPEDYTGEDNWLIRFIAPKILRRATLNPGSISGETNPAKVLVGFTRT